MAMSVKSIQWINLSIPLDLNEKFHPQKITSLNPHEFIVLSHSKLFKYRVNTNEFNESIHSNSKISVGNMAFNNKEQTLHIHGKNDIISINMKTNYSSSWCGVQDGNYFLFINECFHVIDMHDHHWIGSIQN
eukprot:285582_1